MGRRLSQPEVDRTVLISIAIPYGDVASSHI